jgi:hypothetical protein
VSSSVAPTCRSKQTATEELGQNAIVIRVQPDEGITIAFGSKVPGQPWRCATSPWTSATAAPSPSPAPRPTSGSSSTSCSATRRCSRARGGRAVLADP